MDRDKLIDIITEANAFYVTDKDDIGIADCYEMSHKLANHLIANGIGDITAEKRRADVAEEALKILCKNCVECPYVIEDNNKYCKAGFGDGTEECDASKAYLCWAEYYKQQAEQRLKERV